MTVTVGRLVTYVQPQHEAPVNNTFEHPAIVTRVWSERCVNLTVFFDGAQPSPRSSVDRVISGEPSDNDGWHWPRGLG